MCVCCCCLTEEAETLLMDRDSLMEMVNGAHDNRVSVILKKEDETRAREEGGFSSAVSRYREEGKTRNRNRCVHTCMHGAADQGRVGAPRSPPPGRQPGILDSGPSWA